MRRAPRKRGTFRAQPGCPLERRTRRWRKTDSNSRSLRKRERPGGATPGKHWRLGPEPVSGSAFGAAVSDWQRPEEPFAGAGPKVRIRFPPAVSQANFRRGFSGRHDDMVLSGAKRCCWLSCLSAGGLVGRDRGAGAFLSVGLPWYSFSFRDDCRCRESMAAPFNIPAHTTIYRVPRNFYPPWLDERIAASYLSPRYSRSRVLGVPRFYGHSV